MGANFGLHEQSRAAAKPLGFHAPATQSLYQSGRVSLERGHKPRRQRDREHGAPREPRRLHQPVVVEPEGVCGERERDRGETAGVEERARELGRRHVERPDHRDRRTAPEHRAGQAFHERRQHEQRGGRAHRTDQIRPAARDGRSQADGQQHHRKRGHRDGVPGQQRRRGQAEQERRRRSRPHRSPE